MSSPLKGHTLRVKSYTLVPPEGRLFDRTGRNLSRRVNLSMLAGLALAVETASGIAVPKDLFTTRRVSAL